MADLIPDGPDMPAPANSACAGASRRAAPSLNALTGDGAAPDVMGFIELLFFAYRDFVHEPDAILEDIGFGRAHHRVLHFVQRHPGIRVAQLLVVLNITKQSLAPILRELVARGDVEQRMGEADRRERCLYLTDTGAALYARLVAPQRARIAEALAAAGHPAEHAAVSRFLTAMIAPDDRRTLTAMIEAGATVGDVASAAADEPASSDSRAA
ncbi:MAG: MarR family transcriptional regulator [Pseudomonadota bacterium]